MEGARERGVLVRELGLGAHEEIDRATRACGADARGGIVIDGRYLRYVLVGADRRECC